MIVKFQKISDDAKVPAFAHKGDAGMDVFSFESLELLPGEIKAVATGVKMEIPEGYVALVWDKSGLALKNGVKTMGGVIDSGYRGEIKIIMTNLSKEVLKIEKGQKIAQMPIQKFESPEVEAVSELSETKRGDGGFGSTGLK
ncbi:dUTP diphosphatase [Candidatus Azambacteria bacterium]|nr:dUTP diphosphatase [Candidatus Azambacteria bacterium]